MKASIIVITLLTFLTLTTSCSTEERKVNKVARGYLEATADYDFDKAAYFADEATQKSTLFYYKYVLLPVTDSLEIEKNKTATVGIDSTVFTTDSSAIVYFWKKTPIRTGKGKLSMRMQESGWKAHVVITPAPGTEIPPEADTVTLH